ncbi:putative DNA-binding transcriptional regulator YafY [Geothermobacter ehrlichii]|uniref:Putative DNA-binding transcriptional regulator YafY n=1 Tax=Geothermobacter ehrlichii TaxID=213224 RepID=A0A5D3WLS4_9BACT|nr:WYL domain-containing protein [Geothermobacter ehrlichii]TYO99672.1 putative DNA-binding transcriptional regulator YafY [Geothermobacter ehrlichii]
MKKGPRDKNQVLLRQWQMLKHVPRRGRRTAQEIHQMLREDGFDVDLRTVQRDLKQLWEGNIFPLCRDDNKPIGWYWDREADIFDLPGMDPHTALVVRMAESHLESVLPPSCMDLIRPRARQAVKVLDQTDLDHYRRWPYKVRVISRAQPLLPPDIDPQVLKTLYDALLRGVKVRGMYRGVGKQEAEERIFSPQGLVIADPVIYLLASFKDYPKIYHLALHRFESAEALTEKAHVIPEFDLDAYLEAGAFGFPVKEGDTIRLKAVFYDGAGEHLVESPLSTNQTYQREEEDIIITAEVPNTQQLRWWLASFGEMVEVLEPKSLRNEFAEMAKEMLEMYS